MTEVSLFRVACEFQGTHKRLTQMLNSANALPATLLYPCRYDHWPSRTIAKYLQVLQSFADSRTNVMSNIIKRKRLID